MRFLYRSLGAFKIVACMRNVTAKLSLGEPSTNRQSDPPSDSFKCTQKFRSCLELILTTRSLAKASCISLKAFKGVVIQIEVGGFSQINKNK
jgi:hypothetical protein